MPQFEIGQTLGDYEVVGLIGSGGMGEVYRVRNLISERVDAMKVLRPQSENALEAAERFLREIKVHASLKHPNIAVLYTAVRHENQILMFIEMVEGVALDQRLRRGPLSQDEAVRYASQCLGALQYAHEHGVVHRDIKPSNLIIALAGGIKLLDFGIARSTMDLKLTGAGRAVGSAHYMSPEQALGQEADARSDVYSVGILLYEMLLGARPFTGDSMYSVLKAHVEQEPLAPAEINPSISRELSDAVLRALRKRREERFQSAAEFRAHIEASRPAETRTIRMIPTAPSPPPPNQPSDLSTATRIAALLAEELGPIATHLVKQTLTKTSDVNEVCRRVATEVSDESRRKRFLERCATELKLTSLLPVKAVTAPSVTSATKPGPWEPQVLEGIKKALAQYVGPVAKVIVDKAARKCSNLDQLYEVVAAEIESGADRAKFLATKGSK